MASDGDKNRNMSVSSGILHPIFSEQSGAEESRALHALVESWCDEVGGCSAAIYSHGNGPRLATFGDMDFPDRARDAEEMSGLQKVDLPGGGILLHSSEPSLPDAPSEGIALLGAAASIISMKRKLREQNFQAMSQGVELVALYEVGLAIASILDIDELAEEVLSRALMLTECSLGALYTIEDGDFVLAHARGAAERRIAAEDLDLADLRKSGGKPEVVILKDAATVLAVAVEAEGQPRGLLAVGHPATEGHTLTAKDRSTLSLFANQAAIALEQARLHRTEVEQQRMEREMEVAAEIQREILPDTMPSIPGFEVLGWNRPARHVGGDYFGFKQLDDDRWALVLGDVSGKGPGAALLVSTLDSALRVLLTDIGVGVALAERLNAHVWDSTAANKFITLMMAELDPASARLEYVNAGHNDGLVVGSIGDVEHLESAGSPIGMLPGSAYGSGVVDLEPGDLVCFYSDGITECADLDDEEFEIDRLIAVLKEHGEESLEEILVAIDKAVTDFAAGQAQGDDQTVILIRRVD
jgi:sigma-B regulation protein RsbU (phosphoserine phosphatase)